MGLPEGVVRGTRRIKDRLARPAAPIVRQVRGERLTYLGTGPLNDLWRAARNAEAQGVPGLFVEAGCALGGSALVIAAAKAPDRRLTVHDVFGMIPAPTAADGADVQTRYARISAGAARGLGGDPYYGYEPDLLGKVRATFERYDLAERVEFVPGLFQDTLIGDEPVALAHVDGDWYESVKVCLERLGPRLSRGGVIVIDDYDYWSGSRRAVDEWLAANPEFATRRQARLQIVRSA